MEKQEIARLALEDIDDDEDDVGEDDFEPFSSGAPSLGQTRGNSIQSAANIGKKVSMQAVGRLGNVANIANLAQTGNAFSVATTGTSAALAPVVAVTGPIGIALALVDSSFSAYSAVKTYKHVKALEKILLTKGDLAKDGTPEAIIFTIKKKNKKLKRKGLGCVPVFGSICNTVYTAGRTIKKKYRGTKGVERRQHASMLWQNTLLGDQCAIAACKELLGLKVYGLIDGVADGHLVLKKKLRSL